MPVTFDVSAPFIAAIFREYTEYYIRRAVIRRKSHKILWVLSWDNVGSRNGLGWGNPLIVNQRVVYVTHTHTCLLYTSRCV